MQYHLLTTSHSKENTLLGCVSIFNYKDCTVLHICIETGYTRQSKPHMHVYIYAHYEYEATVFMSKNTALNNSRLLVKIT